MAQQFAFAFHPLPPTLDEMSRAQRETDDLAARALGEYMVGRRSREDLECTLALLARMWTRLENEKAAIAAAGA